MIELHTKRVWCVYECRLVFKYKTATRKTTTKNYNYFLTCLVGENMIQRRNITIFGTPVRQYMYKIRITTIYFGYLLLQKQQRTINRKKKIKY